MAAGRPRTTSLPKQDMISLGKEMVAWVKANDPLHLSAWYSIEKMYLEVEWEAMIKCPEFLPYYEQALKIVGQKYLDKNSNVREGISQRWQRVYFKDIKKAEDADLLHKLELEKQKIDHEVKTKAASTITVSDEITAKFDAMMKQISSIQDKS